RYQNWIDKQLSSAQLSSAHLAKALTQRLLREKTEEKDWSRTATTVIFT
ncbi:LOW QUALITY PROTEIN: hypothetical protein PanWU01x14_076950, partial [Parasponia andersonii]